MPNMITLAYLGDAVYELNIRKRLLKLEKVNAIQKESLKYVSASSQRKHLEYLVKKNLLTEEEIDIFKRGRNAHGGKSKSTDIVTYRIATGLECVFGYLFLNNQMDRIEELINIIMEEKWEFLEKMYLMKLKIIKE